MTAMRTVGYRLQLPTHARVRETEEEYVVELDVSDFTRSELEVEALGAQITVRGDQAEGPADEGRPFRLHERLEECFRLPDDADVNAISVFHRHGTLEIHAKRLHAEPRRLRIERCRSGYVLDPDAVGV